MKAALTGGSLAAIIACAAFDALAALVAIFVLRGRRAQISTVVVAREEVEARLTTGPLSR